MTIKRKFSDAVHFEAVLEAYVNGDPPFAYRVENKKLVPRSDDTLEVVKSIFKMYLDGHDGDYIAGYLTLNGYDTPAMVKGKRNAGVQWYDSTVKLILPKPHYAGHLVQFRMTTRDVTTKKRIVNEKPVVFKDAHEAIISLEDFDAVQKLMKSRKVAEGQRLRSTCFQM